MRFSKPSPIFALGQCLFVLPATIFLTAAALRLLQPRQYQPAFTSWIIFDWTTTHVSHLGAAILFIALPAVGAMSGACCCWARGVETRHCGAMRPQPFRLCAATRWSPP